MAYQPISAKWRFAKTVCFEIEDAETVVLVGVGDGLWCAVAVRKLGGCGGGSGREMLLELGVLGLENRQGTIAERTERMQSMSADVDNSTNVLESTTESAAKGAVKKSAKTQKKQQKEAAGGKVSKEAKGAGAAAKSSKKKEQTYPLSLTLFQREWLLKQTRLRGKLTKKIVEAGRGTKAVLVTLEELNILDDQVGLAAYLADGTYRRHLVAILDRVSAILEEVDAATLQLDASATAKKSAGKKGQSCLPVLDRPGTDRSTDLAANSSRELHFRHL